MQRTDFARRARVASQFAPVCTALKGNAANAPLKASVRDIVFSAALSSSRLDEVFRRIETDSPGSRSRKLSDIWTSRSPNDTATLRASADDDRFIYKNYEIFGGFGGSQLLLRFVFWIAGTSTFSSDASFPFVGTCSQPSGSETELKIQAVSLINMTGTKFPTTLIQRLCPNQFPTTVAQRQDGADNPDSWYYAWRA
jgi:hypothetical protein